MRIFRAIQDTLLLRQIIFLIIVVGNVNANNAQISQNVYGVQTGIAYYVPVVIGQPEYNPSSPNSSTMNTFRMLIDTGSANEAVATRKCCLNATPFLYSCEESSTCVATTDSIAVQYISGNWRGYLVHDTFSGPQLGKFKDIPFVEIETQQQFIQSGYDGILGLAYTSIAQPSSNPPISLYESLVDSHSINDIFSLQLCGVLQGLVQSKTTQSPAGQWLIGGIDGLKGEKYYTGDIMYSPIIQDKWYVVLVTDLGVGDESIQVNCETLNSPQAIIDSGTSNMVLPNEAYEAVLYKIKEITSEAIPEFDHRYFNQDTPCCTSICDPSNANSPLLDLPSITVSFAFHDGSDTKQQFTVTVPPTYYWRPIQILRNSNCRIWGIAEGDGMVLGNVFMDGLLIVHDRANEKIGIAVTSNCQSNVTSSKEISTVSSSGDWCKCFSSSEKHDSLLSSYLPGRKPCFFWFWWMYFVLGCIVIVILSITYVGFVTLRTKIRRRRANAARLHERTDLGSVLLTPSQLGGNSTDNVVASNNSQRQYLPTTTSKI